MLKKEQLETSKSIRASQAKCQDIAKLEQKVGRVYVGSMELDNKLKVRADMYTEPAGWILHINIKYNLNGESRSIKGKADMSDIDNSYQMDNCIRELVTKDLTKWITVESVKQNKRAIAAAHREFMG